MYNTGSSGSFGASSQPAQCMRGGLEHDPNDPVKNNTENHISFIFFSPMGAFLWKDVNHFLHSSAGCTIPPSPPRDSVSLSLTQYVEGESKPLLEACSD